MVTEAGLGFFDGDELDWSFRDDVYTKRGLALLLLIPTSRDYRRSGTWFCHQHQSLVGLISSAEQARRCLL